MTRSYYMPKPLSPKRDPIAWMLWITLSMLAAGLILGGLFSYGLADVGIIPIYAQSVLSLIASALVMIGVEGNTLPTGVIIFQKWDDTRSHWLDRAALIASFVGSVLTAVIFLSQRQTLFSGSWWRTLALREGPLISAIAIIVDFYGGIASLGRLRRDYDVNMREWLESEQQWNQEHGLVPEIDRSQWKAAKIADFRRLVESLNGSRAHLTAENLQAHFDEMQLRVDAGDSTIRRWLTMETEKPIMETD